MSSHRNADGSITEGYKLESWGFFISHQLGLVCTTVQTLTVAPGAIQAVVQADGQDLRASFDGSTVPTTSSGFLIKNGTSLTLSAADAGNVKLIAVSAGGLANVVYTL